jgi:hypothetical protein
MPETVVFNLGDAKVALVGFIFVCIVFPRIVRNKHAFYLAVLAAIIGGASFGRVCTVLNIVLDMFALALLLMAAGGLSAGELAADIGRAFEVLRKGEQPEEQEVMPIQGQVRKSPANAAAARATDDEEGRTVYVIDDLPKPPKPEKPAEKDKDQGPIPLE